MVAIDRLRRWRAVVVVGVCLAGSWAYRGFAMAERFPDFVTRSSQSRRLSSPEAVRAHRGASAAATVLTNSPHSVWWLTNRQPTSFGFTRPRPGSSHVPLGATQTLAYACRGETYLAWFPRLGNTGQGPSERRPDIAVIVELKLQRSVPGGQLIVSPRATTGSVAATAPPRSRASETQPGDVTVRSGGGAGRDTDENGVAARYWPNPSGRRGP